MISERVQRYTFIAGMACAFILVVGCTPGQDPGVTSENGAPSRSGSAPISRRVDVSGDESPTSGRAVVAETLAYADVDNQLVKGHFVFPEDMVNPLPAVILIHEWLGLDDVTRGLADQIASEGFIVLAIDLYNGRTATTPPKARELMLEVVENPTFATDNIRQASEWVLTTTGATMVATVGYGFGGGWSLSAAMTLPDKVDATVIYYGQVSDNAEALDTIDAPILGLFGGADSAVPVESVTGFENALEVLGKDFVIDVYPGAGSGFATPGHRNFDEKLARKSWSTMVSFLHQHLLTES